MIREIEFINADIIGGGRAMYYSCELGCIFHKNDSEFMPVFLVAPEYRSAVTELLKNTTFSIELMNAIGALIKPIDSQSNDT